RLFYDLGSTTPAWNLSQREGVRDDLGGEVRPGSGKVWRYPGFGSEFYDLTNSPEHEIRADRVVVHLEAQVELKILCDSTVNRRPVEGPLKERLRPEGVEFPIGEELLQEVRALVGCVLCQLLHQPCLGGRLHLPDDQLPLLLLEDVRIELVGARGVDQVDRVV